jgi:hypothetical protein
MSFKLIVEQNNILVEKFENNFKNKNEDIEWPFSETVQFIHARIVNYSPLIKFKQLKANFYGNFYDIIFSNKLTNNLFFLVIFNR